MAGTIDRTPLTKLEKQAVKAFTQALTESAGARVQQVDLFGTASPEFLQTRDIQVLVLTDREDDGFEDSCMDLVLNVLLETGIYLNVKSFSKRRYQAFRKAEIPMIQQMEKDRTSLWKAA